MANTRMTVVVRRDLNMPSGLMAAQVAHISDAFMRERIVEQSESVTNGVVNFTSDELDWMCEPYISVLAVDNVEELGIITDEAIEAGLTVHKWTDLIPSKNLNRPIPDVWVGTSIGPCDFDKAKAITGTLPLA